VNGGRRSGGGPGHQVLADVPQSAAAASSRALADGTFTLPLAKYLPVTPSTSGDEHR